MSTGHRLTDGLIFRRDSCAWPLHVHAVCARLSTGRSAIYRARAPAHLPLPQGTAGSPAIRVPVTRSPTDRAGMAGPVRIQASAYVGAVGAGGRAGDPPGCRGGCPRILRSLAGGPRSGACGPEAGRPGTIPPQTPGTCSSTRCCRAATSPSGAGLSMWSSSGTSSCSFGQHDTESRVRDHRA